MKNKLYNYLLRNYWVLFTDSEKCYVNKNIRLQATNNVLSSDNIIFQNEVVKRLLEHYPTEIFLNKCPICGELARTPNAKSASCGHVWYNKDT